MEKVASNFNYGNIEKLLFNMYEDHSSSVLNKLKGELNKFFFKAKCTEVLYTNNTDKLFFGMRVYPMLDGSQAMDVITSDQSHTFDKYAVEFDSKLFDPMLCLDEKELTAILLHEVGHIVYDTGTIDDVKNHVNMYFAKSGDYVDAKASKGYRELMAYALKDSVMKAGSIFSKIGNDEIIADSFVAGCGYGPYLESAMRKIATSATYLNKSVDDRFVALAWVLRLRSEFNLRRIPAIKTLNKAKTMTASKLEQKEIAYAANIVSKSDLGFSEGAAIDNVKDRWSKKLAAFKTKGVRSIRNDVYELNLRLRQAEDMNDLLYVIRTVNNDIAIIQDYLNEEITEDERKACLDTLEELYDIRQKAAKDKQVRDRYSSMINVTYV